MLPIVILGPLAVDAVAAEMPGLLLAGDAAGFIDPMTGDGLRFAFRGAVRTAGRAAAISPALLRHAIRYAGDARIEVRA